MSKPLLLVLRALGLGDLLTAVPALRGLAEAFPDHRRVLLAPRALAPLLPLVRDARGEQVVAGLQDTAPLGRIARQLGHPQVAVNLHGRGPQSHRTLLALAPERLIAFFHPEVQESGLGARWLAGEYEVGRWCRLLGEAGVHCDPSALSLDRPSGDRARLQTQLSGATLVHPGAASIARRWPPERWAAVAAAERAVGRTVLVTGGDREIGLAARVAREAGLAPESVLAGRTGLRELAVVVAAAGRVACSDTGLAHMATALGTPSVVLFGPVAPAEWGPPAGRARHQVLWSGRRGDPHGQKTDAGLLDISVSEVLDALERLPPAAGDAAPVPHAAAAAGAVDRAPGLC